MADARLSRAMSTSGIYTRSLTVEASFRDWHAELLIIGELNRDTRHLLTDMLDLVLVHQPRELLVNMRGVRDIDQEGLQLILQAAGRLPDGHGSSVIVHPSAAVQELLDSTGLDARLRAGADG